MYGTKALDPLGYGGEFEKISEVIEAAGDVEIEREKTKADKAMIRRDDDRSAFTIIDEEYMKIVEAYQDLRAKARFLADQKEKHKMLEERVERHVADLSNHQYFNLDIRRLDIDPQAVRLGEIWPTK